jgi:hypothetical protein
MTIEKILDDCANTIKKQQAEIEAFKKEKEDREFAIYATGYWKGVEYKRMRELTDEEIIELYHFEPRFDALGNFGYLNFARAILKKASEK